jgi:regulatory protein
LKRDPSLRERAVALLARREHSRAELGRKLARHTEDREEIDAVLDDLVRRKLLSDERFAEARATSLSRKFGAVRIQHELRRSGISDAAATMATDATRATEVERARAAWQKRFGAAPASRDERAKQMRFLQGRGFSFDTIRAVIEGATDDE